MLVLLHVYLDCHDTPTAAAGGKRLLCCVCIEERLSACQSLPKHLGELGFLATLSLWILILWKSITSIHNA